MLNLEHTGVDGMDGQLSKVIMDGLDAARFKGPERQGSFHVVAGGQYYPVLRMWKTGFSLAAAGSPKLRGTVELYEGQRHASMCLVVASAPQDGEIVFTFKRSTPVMDGPALDFVVAPDEFRSSTGQDMSGF